MAEPDRFTDDGSAATADADARDIQLRVWRKGVSAVQYTSRQNVEQRHSCPGAAKELAAA
jgi:hypothetical protein